MVSLAPREFPAPFAVDIGEPAGDDQRHRPDRDAAEQYWGWFPEKAGGADGEHEQAGPNVRPDGDERGLYPARRDDHGAVKERYPLTYSQRPDGRRFSPVTAQDTAPDTPEESI